MSTKARIGWGLAVAFNVALSVTPDVPGWVVVASWLATVVLALWWLSEHYFGDSQPKKARKVANDLEMPTKHPRVHPIRVGSPPQRLWKGLFVKNEGWPAVNIVLNPFKVGPHLMRFENGEIPRLEGRDGEVFREFWASDPTLGDTND